MLTKNLGKNSKWGTAGLALGLCVLLLSLPPAWGAGPDKPQPAPAAETPAGDVIFLGKFFCSLKRQVMLPFPARLTSLNVKPGQAVTEGEVLATFTLLPESVAQIRRRVTAPQLRELQVKLADVDKALVDLGHRQRTANQLEKQNLASPQSLLQLDRELALVSKQKKVIQESLAVEQQVAKDDLTILREQLGVAVHNGVIPEVISLKAPINGHVIWINSELREGALFPSPQPMFQIGVMDPMVLRAQVHEIEVMQLTPSERADVTVESLPGRKFEAQLSRLPWAPLTSALDQPSYYDVEFRVANPDLILKEGLKARVSLRKPK